MPKTDLDDSDHLIRALRKDLDRIIAEEGGSATSGLMKAGKTMNMVVTESVRIQRLYFVVRSVLMSLISALVYFLVVLYFGAINAIQAAFLGVFVFVAALVVSRLFDKQIVTASKKIIRFLNRHERLKTFVMRKL